jgi:TolB-like protein
VKQALVLVAAWACLSPRASTAATVTIAVMPFKDLSGGPGAIGEAIRETVTTDLTELSGVKVIERSNLDKILAEQNLQSKRNDLDPSTAARIGKLLGATLICGGAYQKASPKVRLTARFISVETGQILDTAKVDGDEKEFLKLQDRITAQLLKHAKLGQHAQKFEQRSRPPVRGGLKTLENYGQSLLTDDDASKMKYLKLALADDANFSYAVNDLAALEKRMKLYQSNADAVRDEAARKAHAQLASETDPGKLMALMSQIFTGLLQSRRYHAMAAEARFILKNPPKTSGPGYPGLPSIAEMASFWLIQSENSLGDLDGVLRDGEKFLRDSPASMYFGSIKAFMDAAINEKHKVEEAKADLAKDLEELKTNAVLKDDICKLGTIYAGHFVWAEAKKLLHRCIEIGGTKYFPPSMMMPMVLESDIKTLDFESGRRDLAAWEKISPSDYRNSKMAYELRIPMD